MRQSARRAIFSTTSDHLGDIKTALQYPAKLRLRSQPDNKRGSHLFLERTLYQLPINVIG